MSKVPGSPITGRTGAQLVWTLSPAEVARRWRAELNVDPGPEFESLAALSLWRCPDTGLEWYEPGQAAGSESLYAKLQAFDWYYMAEKWEFRQALAALEPGARILEVGAGPGDFLAMARGKGHSVVGLEFNESAVKTAQARGLDVRQDDLQAFGRNNPEPFDAVCSFQVLEHVPDPGNFLRALIDRVRVGGKLILSVPNAEVLRGMFPHGEELLDEPPHHMSHWSASVFRALQGHLPLRVVDLKREPLQPYHVAWFVRAHAQQLRQRLGSVLGPILVNRLTRALVTLLIAAGPRRFLPGHTLLAVMSKTRT